MEKWFKFYSADYLVDGKIRAMSGNERSCLLTLLCLADTSDIPGFINNIPEVDLLWLSGLSVTEPEWQETLGVLDKFQKMGILIRSDNDCVEIVNFRKRQGDALTAYERVKKQRALKRKNDKMIRNDTDDNEMIRPRREKKRKEENKEKRKGRFAPPSKEDVKAYCLERNNQVNAQSFIDFYTAKDWLIGKTRMKDWRAAVRTWENRDKQSKSTVLKANPNKYDKFN
jgi:hypothetical protein|tara:strand:+ start:879 stop:1559 length:681 start_codon:yes stop_codon:yes gene_type:complete